MRSFFYLFFYYRPSEGKLCYAMKLWISNVFCAPSNSLSLWTLRIMIMMGHFKLWTKQYLDYTKDIHLSVWSANKINVGNVWNSCQFQLIFTSSSYGRRSCCHVESHIVLYFLTVQVQLLCICWAAGMFSCLRSRPLRMISTPGSSDRLFRKVSLVSHHCSTTEGT